MTHERRVNIAESQILLEAAGLKKIAVKSKVSKRKAELDKIPAIWRKVEKSWGKQPGDSGKR